MPERTTDHRYEGDPDRVAAPSEAERHGSDRAVEAASWAADGSPRRGGAGSDADPFDIALSLILPAGDPVPLRSGHIGPPARPTLA